MGCKRVNALRLVISTYRGWSVAPHEISLKSKHRRSRARLRHSGAVAEHQCALRVVEEFGFNLESLGQTFGAWLHGCQMYMFQESPSLSRRWKEA